MRDRPQGGHRGSRWRKAEKATQPSGYQAKAPREQEVSNAMGSNLEITSFMTPTFAVLVICKLQYFTNMIIEYRCDLLCFMF